jgi:hypothetical protein
MTPAIEKLMNDAIRLGQIFIRYELYTAEQKKETLYDKKSGFISKYEHPVHGNLCFFKGLDKYYVEVKKQKQGELAIRILDGEKRKIRYTTEPAPALKFNIIDQAMQELVTYFQGQKMITSPTFTDYESLKNSIYITLRNELIKNYENDFRQSQIASSMFDFTFLLKKQKGMLYLLIFKGLNSNIKEDNPNCIVSIETQAPQVIKLGEIIEKPEGFKESVFKIGGDFLLSYPNRDFINKVNILYSITERNAIHWLVSQDIDLETGNAVSSLNPILLADVYKELDKVAVQLSSIDPLRGRDELMTVPINDIITLSIPSTTKTKELRINEDVFYVRPGLNSGKVYLQLYGTENNDNYLKLEPVDLGWHKDLNKATIDGRPMVSIPIKNYVEELSENIKEEIREKDIAFVKEQLEIREVCMSEKIYSMYKENCASSFSCRVGFISEAKENSKLHYVFYRMNGKYYGRLTTIERAMLLFTNLERIEDEKRYSSKKELVMSRISQREPIRNPKQN